MGRGASSRRERAPRVGLGVSSRGEGAPRVGGGVRIGCVERGSSRGRGLESLPRALQKLINNLRAIAKEIIAVKESSYGI